MEARLTHVVTPRGQRTTTYRFTPVDSPGTLSYQAEGRRDWTMGGLFECKVDPNTQRVTAVTPLQDVDESLVLPADVREVYRDLRTGGLPLLEEKARRDGNLFKAGCSSPVLAWLRHSAFLDPAVDLKGVRRSFAVHCKDPPPTKSLVHVGMERAWATGVFANAASDAAAMAARRRASLEALAKQIRAASEARKCAGLKALAKETDVVHRKWSFQVKWRLCVGVGNPSPWGAGLAIHPLFGVPILPAPALASAARRGGILAGAREDEITDVLGSGKAPRPIILPDAFPECSPEGRGVTLEADVITPHFKEVGPDSGMNPVPTTFLTVAWPTVFVVEAVGPEDLLDTKLHPWLTLQLLEWGIGAKTSAGYGRLVPHPTSDAQSVV